MDSFNEIFEIVFGYGEALTTLQMCSRAIVVYLLLIVCIKFGHRRLIAGLTATDYMMVVIIGSTVSRTINGSAPFIPTLIITVLLFFCHWAISFLSYHSTWIYKLVTNKDRVLIHDGKFNIEELRKCLIREEDVHGAMRRCCHGDDISKIAEAILEKDGKISFKSRN